MILVVNVVGELQRKRTLAASRGFLAAARLSCFHGEGRPPDSPPNLYVIRRSCKAFGKSRFSCTPFQTPGSITESSILCCQWSFKFYLAGARSQVRRIALILGQDIPRRFSFMTAVIRAYFIELIRVLSLACIV